MPQPTIPRSKTNPVGQADKIRRARDAVFADIDKAQQDALDAWAALPVARQNGRVLNRAFYEYLIDLPALKNIVDAIATTLRRGTGRTVLQAQVEAAYKSGVGQASANLSRLIDDYTRSVTAALSDYNVMRRAALAGARSYEYMDGFAGDTAADLARVMFQAVQDGQNPHDVARVIRQRFGVSRMRAERIARTEITGALRRGRWDEAKDAEEKFGLEVRLIHVSALIPERTRSSHAARHGRIYTREEEADWYSKDGNAINCVLPGAKMAGQFVAGSKAFYQGEAIRIMTAGGNDLSVTPNHPVMTDRGLVPAAELTEGDNLVAYIGDAENLAGVSPLHSDLIYPAIEDVFSALVNLGHSFLAGVSAVDFHGDAAGMDEYVNIVDANGVLTFAGQTTINKLLQDLSFVKSDATPLRLGALEFGGSAVRFSASGSVCSLDTGKALLGSEHFTFEPLSIAGAPGCKAAFVKPSIDGNTANSILFTQGEDGFSSDMFSMHARNIKPAFKPSVPKCVKSGITKPDMKRPVSDADAISNLLDAFAGFAARDKIINVEKFTFAGHVYDLQDVSGLMLANNIVISNCLCSTSEITFKDGMPIFGEKLLARMADARKRFVG